MEGIRRGRSLLRPVRQGQGHSVQDVCRRKYQCIAQDTVLFEGLGVAGDNEHGGGLAVRDGAVMCVTRYGASEPEGGSVCPTRVQKISVGGRNGIGSRASCLWREGRLKDHGGKHFGSGVPSTVSGQSQL